MTTTQTKQTVIEKLTRIVRRGKRISLRVKQALELIELLSAEPPEQWNLIRFLACAGRHFDPEILALGEFRIGAVPAADAAIRTLREYLNVVSPQTLAAPENTEGAGLTSRQAAEYLGVSRTAVLNYARAGELPCIWEGGKRRFRRVDLDAFRDTLPRPRGRKQK